MSSVTTRLLASSALFALVAAPAFSQTLTVSWWGFNGDKLNEFIVQPFQEQCGCELVFETGNNADRLNRVQIRGGSGVDVIYLTDSFSQIEGLHELAQAPQGEFGPAYTIGRVGVVYDAEKVSAPITSWNDLWREDLASSVSLPGITTTAGPMVVMIAGDKAGTSAFEDADPAFAEIEAIKPNVVKNYNTGSEMINLFSTGEITVSLAQDFALAQLQAAVPTVVWADLEDGAIATLNTVNIPVGAVEVELAHQFINFILDPEVQATLAKNGVDAPVHAAVELTPEEARQWTYGTDMIAGLKRVDYSQMNAVKGDWVDRWNEVFGM